MSRDRKNYLTDRCPFCREPVRVRRAGPSWVIACAPCMVIARAGQEMKVYENWLNFRQGMEKRDKRKK